MLYLKTKYLRLKSVVAYMFLNARGRLNRNHVTKASRISWGLGVSLRKSR